MLIDFRTKDGRQGLFDRWNIKPKGVLHVGGNIGEEAPVYLELGIKKQIWIEANLEIATRLQGNISSNTEAMALCFAASDYDGYGTLHISNNGSQSSSLLELGTHKIAHPEVHYTSDNNVSVKRLDSVLNERKQFEFLDCNYLYDPKDFDFLNMDIQGNELKALRGMGELLHQFKWAYLEVNKEELYKGCALVEDIDFYLASFGFQRVETKWCGNTGWGDALYVKN